MRMMHNFEFGSEVYSETYNIRGSSYVGRTKCWCEIEAEELEMEKSPHNYVKMCNQNQYRQS